VKIDLEEKEFVALTADAIQKLLRAGEDRTADRRQQERRREPRWPFASPVQLWVRNRMGQEVEIHATCINLTETGLGLSCEKPLESGLCIPIAIHQAEATYHGKGVVRHCTPSNGEYFVGIELVESPDA
jgi:hypothetical protein